MSKKKDQQKDEIATNSGSKGNSKRKSNQYPKSKSNQKSRGNSNSSNNKKGNTSRNYTDKDRTNDSDALSGKRAAYDSVKSNNIEWWNKSPMYPDVVRVPFNRIYGAGYATPMTTSDEGGLVSNGFSKLSGIMTLDFVPAIGSSHNADSAVNRAFTSLFGSLYSKTTGTPPIQQMDVAMFITSLASVATAIGHVKRAIGVSQLYNSQNYNYPRNLLEAMGFQPASIIGKQDELRYKLNDCILNFNNMKVPDVMDIYVRQYALAHNVYCDEDDVTSQMYIFRPAGMYEYRDAVGGEVGYLKWRPMIYGLTAQAWISRINNALEMWRNSSDLALISGTIQRAFSDMDTISLDYLFETDVVVPTVDRNILWQINNATITPVDGTTLDITQDPVKNILKFDPDPGDIMDSIHLAQDCHVLNSYDGETGDEFIMEATRLIVFKDEETGGLIFPTEFISGARVWWSEQELGGGIGFQARHFSQTESFLVDVSDFTNFDKLFDFIELSGLLTQFKIHPMVSIWRINTGVSEGLDLIARIGDLYKFTTIDNSALKGLYLAATQSVYRTVGG